MAEQVIHDLSAGERGVTIMLAGKLTPPAFIEVENESGSLLQRYTPVRSRRRRTGDEREFDQGGEALPLLLQCALAIEPANASL